MRFKILLLILFVCLLCSCATSSPVRVTEPPEDNSTIIDGQRMDIVVAEAKSAEELVSALKEITEDDKINQMRELVLEKMSSESIPIYYNYAYLNTKYTLSIYQDGVLAKDFDLTQPFEINIICSFAYDDLSYSLVYSKYFVPFIGYDCVVETDGKKIRLCGTHYPNGNKEVTAFVIEGEDNMQIRPTNESFLGRYLPDDDVVLPADFFDVEKLYIEQ